MRRYVAMHDELVLKMVTLTLNKIARGGMYGQLGDGFHRYSIDAVWGTLHFERMMYDNTQLARVYLHAWQIPNGEFYCRIAEETLDHIVRVMTHPRGVFTRAVVPIRKDTRENFAFGRRAKFAPC